MPDDTTRDGLGGTDGIQTRHHEYSGRYEMVRRLLQNGQEPMLGQIALIMLDLLEEFAQVRAELAELNATNLELIVQRRPL